MKRICLIIHSLGIGGMERVMAQLAANFSEREHTKVDLILIGKKREVIYSLPESIRIHRPFFLFENSKRTIDTLRTLLFLRKKVKEIDPDTILSFGEYWNNLVLLSLFGLSYPIYISDRSEPGKNLGMIQNFLRNRLYPHAAGYIAQTGAAKQVCLASGWNENIQVIGNPIRKIQSNDTLKKENIVLSVGRLIKTKHFDQLIKMFAEIVNSDWKLIIVGGDAKRLNLSQDLHDLIHELGAENSIFLEGEQKDIDSYYRKSKIFAFTSSSEGFPNVLGEAMACDLPLIAFDCVAGPSELIDDGVNGFLIPLFDTEKFEEKLRILIKDEALREKMGRHSKKRAERYSIENIGEKFYSFIVDES